MVVLQQVPHLLQDVEPPVVQDLRQVGHATHVHLLRCDTDSMSLLGEATLVAETRQTVGVSLNRFGLTGRPEVAEDRETASSEIRSSSSRSSQRCHTEKEEEQAQAGGDSSSSDVTTVSPQLDL